MSQLALLKAVRDVLRAAPVSYANAQCEVMFDGQPPPNAPEKFIAVHPGNWSATDFDSLDERYAVDITVTVRVGKVPRDQMGLNALVGPTGASLDRELELIRKTIHSSYTVLTNANTIITAAADGFVEPLRFRNASAPQPRGPEWFHAYSQNEEPIQPPMGLSQTLSFGEARRVQTIESMT